MKRLASSTSFPASEASASGLSARACERSPFARSILTAEPSSPSTGPTSPATTTCEPSQPSAWRQTELFPISSAAASRARTSALQGKVLGSPANDPVFGPSTPVSLASYDPAMSSWRTFPRYVAEACPEFSETWPRSGMTRSGIAYQLPPLVRLTAETGSGLLPTPQATDAKGSCAKLSHKRLTTRHLKHWVHGTALAIHSTTGLSSWVNPNFAEWMMGFPRQWISGRDYTPTAIPSSRRSPKRSAGRS